MQGTTRKIESYSRIREVNFFLKKLKNSYNKEETTFNDILTQNYLIYETQSFHWKGFRIYLCKVQLL